MSKIIILDFTSAEVHVYNYDEAVWEDCEEFMMHEEINLNPNNCQWMVVNDLNIKIH